MPEEKDFTAWAHVAGRLSPSDQARRRAALRLLLPPIVVFCASFVANTEFSIGVWESGLVAVPLVTGLLVFGIGFLLSLARKRWRPAKAQALCLFALLASVPISSRASADYTNTSLAAVSPVIEALDAFRKDTGEYPLLLSELVPGYLFSIEEVRVSLLRSESLSYFGPDRQVSREGGGMEGSYVLALEVSGGQTQHFASKLGAWFRHERH